jgi:hypothetical protein
VNTENGSCRLAVACIRGVPSSNNAGTSGIFNGIFIIFLNSP